MTYRADIDGLRAVAVLAVILFHAAPYALPGGFVGVDIFFVISGYLITRLISENLETGRFSFIGFYERRVLRLVPALIVVCAVTLMFGHLFYGPADYERLAKALKSVVLIHSNNYYLKTSGYFSAPPETTPLLHAWSLSVEEQFYLVFPFALVMFRRFRIKPAAWMGLVALVSFALSCRALIRHPEAAFFLLPYRAWEFLVGSLMTLPMAHRIVTVRIAPLIGIVLIGASFVLLDSTSSFPAWGALAPCLGAALIIRDGKTMVARALASKVPNYIGRISYSLYLWHWPFLCCAEYWLARRLGFGEAMGALLLSFALASLSYHLIEQPFRRKGSVAKPIAALGLTSLLFIAAAGISALHGLPNRLPASVAGYLTKDALHVGLPDENCRIDELISQDGRLRQLKDYREPQVCRVGAQDQNPTVLLWGDSHAQALGPAMDLALKQSSKAGYAISTPGCPPLLGIFRADRPKYDCREFNEAVSKLIETMHPAAVVLAARWPFYFERSTFGNEQNEPPQVQEDHFDIGAPSMAAGIQATFSWLADRHIKTFVVDTVPEMAAPVPQNLARMILTDHATLVDVPLQVVQQRQHNSQISLQEAAKQFGFDLVEPSEVFCSQSICVGGTDHEVLYVDNNHLSTEGAAKVAPLLERAMKQ